MSKIAEVYVSVVPTKFDVEAVVSVEGKVIVNQITNVASLKITNATLKFSPELGSTTVNIPISDSYSLDNISNSIKSYLESVEANKRS